MLKNLFILYWVNWIEYDHLGLDVKKVSFFVVVKSIIFKYQIN